MLHHMPGPEILEALYSAAASHAHEISSKVGRPRGKLLSGRFRTRGARAEAVLPFVCCGQAHPPVMEMRVRTPVHLAPQRWLPDGKQWIQVQDVSGFKTGDHLEGTLECTILECRAIPFGLIRGFHEEKLQAWKKWRSRLTAGLVTLIFSRVECILAARV